MKKILGLLLCLSLLCACSLGTSVDNSSREDMIKVKVLQVEEKRLLVESDVQEMLLLISDQTEFINGDISSIEEGDDLWVKLDSVMMPSLPPQVNALEIEIID